MYTYHILIILLIYSTKLFYCNTWLNLISPSIFAQISISIPFLNSLGNSAFKTAQDIEFWWNIKGVISRKPKKTKIQKHQIYRWDFSRYAHSCPSEKWQKSENCLKMDIFFINLNAPKAAIPHIYTLGGCYKRLR